MTILVTGGAGYIGSHVCKELYNQGYEIVVIDNLSTGNKWALQWGKFEYGDLSDKVFLNSIFQKFHFNAVVHLAACAYVGESSIAPMRYYKNNVVNSINLIEAMLQAGVKNLVFSSSCATYGNPISEKIGLDHPQIPINPYGNTKLAIEKFILDCSSAYGLNSISLRYFNAAGADADCDIGEFHDPETHLIPSIFNSILRITGPLQIYGNDYATFDGTCVRDFVHVSDLAIAHVAAISSLLLKRRFRPSYNLGGGQGLSVLEVIRSVETVTGAKVPYELKERRVGDPPYLVADPSVAASELEWTAANSCIEKIVSSAWNWHIKINSR